MSRFAKMTEIKIAQGAKQVGGGISASHNNETISYFYGTKPHIDIKNPNRPPFANSFKDLFDFMDKLREISNKPVGMKIVISSETETENIVRYMKKRIEHNESIPYFITIDGGDGGTSKGPIELMERVGLSIHHSVFLFDNISKKYGIREKFKIIASGKLLTSDDIVIIKCLGADMVSIARGFMMSAGCIRARKCGEGNCPVGIATMNKNKRNSFIISKQYKRISNYHNNLINNIKMIMSVIGKKRFSDLDNNDLSYKYGNYVEENINKIFINKELNDSMFLKN